MKALTVMAAGGALIVALWAPAVGAEDSQRDREDRKEQQENRGRRGGEHHPQIRGAMHALKNAERHLEHAAHDFGGHRARALELIKQAEQELYAGLEYDRTHEKSGAKQPSSSQPGASTKQ